MIVIDASALVDVLLQPDTAGEVTDRVAAAGAPLHAPHLIDIEVAHAFRRHAASGIIDDARARTALVRLAAFPLRRYPHTPHLPRIWELRHNLSSYDAAYVALAEILEAPLVTCDRRLGRSSGHEARIEVF